MKQKLLFLLIIVFSIFSLGISLSSASGEEPPAGDVLCMPAVYQVAPENCKPLGPSAYLTRLNNMGVELPLEPLKYEQPEYELTYTQFLYGQVVTPNAPVYGSKEDASKSKNPIYRMEGVFNYISYTYTEVLNEVRVYMIDGGVWMNANNVHRIGTPNYQGMLIEKQPKHAFGWILQGVETKESPGYGVSDYTGKFLNRLQVYQVLTTKEVDGLEWLMILPGEWIEKRYLGRVIPRTTSPIGVEGGRWIEVNLYDQTIAVYENYRIVFATLISSGIDPFWTRPGTFQIYQKLETTRMTGSFEVDRSDYYYLEDVPWTMYFDEARALHGAYWHTGYGYPRSHGCVNLSPGDAQWIFNWAQEGDWVHVFDPSGQTPEDPSLYGSGGA